MQNTVNTKRTLKEQEKRELVKAIEDGERNKILNIIDIMENINENIGEANETILILVSRLGDYEIVANLINLGADVNKAHHFSALMEASYLGDLPIVQLLIDSGADINFVNHRRNSALSRACLNGQIEVVSFLVSHKDIDIIKCGGEALINSVCGKQFDISKLLISKGANINYLDIYKSSALHYSCLYGSLQIVELLMDNGADETIKDKNGLTPIELVTANNEIKEYISNYNSSKYILK